MRYKDGLPPLMIYTTLRAVMIYQACGLDKKHCRKRYVFCSVFWRRRWDLEPSFAAMLIFALSNQTAKHLSPFALQIWLAVRSNTKRFWQKQKRDRMSPLLLLAEKVGFEPTRRFHALRDFESRLFDLLSTSPYFVLRPYYCITNKLKLQ